VHPETEGEQENLYLIFSGKNKSPWFLAFWMF
jgi:hypothetical protein